MTTATRHPAAIPAVDEPAIAAHEVKIEQRAREWRPEMTPKGIVQEWLFRQVVINSVLVDVYQAEQIALKPRLAERARLFWEQDQEDEVVRIAARLKKEPSRTVHRLRQSPQGCDWLLSRWIDLGLSLRENGEWTPEQRTLAFDLLGRDPALRTLDPWPRGSSAQELVETTIAELQAHRDGPAVDLDAFRRANAERGLELEPVPALDRLRRRETAAFRRFQWAMDQLAAGGVDTVMPELIAPAEEAPPPAPAPRVPAAPLPPPRPAPVHAFIRSPGFASMPLNRHERRAQESRDRRDGRSR